MLRKLENEIQIDEGRIWDQLGQLFRDTVAGVRNNLQKTNTNTMCLSSYVKYRLLGARVASKYNYW